MRGKVRKPVLAEFNVVKDLIKLRDSDGAVGVLLVLEPLVEPKLVPADEISREEMPWYGRRGGRSKVFEVDLLSGHEGELPSVSGCAAPRKTWQMTIKLPTV